MNNFRNPAILLAAFCLSLFIGEPIVRIFYNFPKTSEVRFKGSSVEGRESFFKLSDDPVMLYELKKPPFKENVYKEKGVFRIIVLGDSTTYMLEQEENYYPKILESLLNTDGNGLKYEVMNAGVIGYNTVQEAEYLKKRLLRYSPDLVIVGYCACNDRVIKRRLIKYEEGLYCSDVAESYPYILNLPFNKYLLSHSSLYRLINLGVINAAKKLNFASLSAKIKYFDLTFGTETAIKELKELSLKNNFGLLFAIIPPIDKTYQYECDWVADKCREYSIDFIDLRRVFSKHSAEELTIFEEDASHFNKFGNQLIAPEIYSYIVNAKYKK